MTMDRAPRTTDVADPLVTAYWPATSSSHAVDVTVGDALRDAARCWPDRMALVDGTKSPEERRQWTYAQLLDISLRWAGFLRREFEPGERVAVWAANCPEWIFLQFGAAFAGLTLVTVNPAYRSGELGFVLSQSRAQGIAFQRELRGRDLSATVREVAVRLPELRWATPLDEVARRVDADVAGTTLPPVGPEDPVQIQYTSGTTGFPKGAHLAHRGMAFNALAYAEAIGAAATDTWVNPMPLFHTAGCGLATLGPLRTGGCQVLARVFEPELMLDLIAAYRATVILAVPTMLIRMLDSLPPGSGDMDSLRIASTGGAPVPVDLIRRVEGGFGVTVAIGFGQTESSPYITHTRPGRDLPYWAETVGRPLPHVEVKISRPDGSVAGLEERGEICTRGICVMKGYFENPEATARAIDHDGWLHTGDIGSMDAHGYVRVLGRGRDLIIRGGENIYPREVEAALFRHPDVTDVAVVGLPDPEWGEIVGAFVRTAKPLTADELHMFLRDKLAGYKIPQVWRFPADFPQTASGKVRKFALRDRYIAETQASEHEGEQGNTSM